MTTETLLRRYALRTTDDPDLVFVGNSSSSFYGIGDRRDNVIESLGGKDTLRGGTGADTLIGGAGNDIYSVDEFDEIIEYAGDGIDTVWSYDRTGSYSLPDHVEILIQRTTIRDGGSLFGNELDNQIIGGSAGDTIDGHGGSDTLTGGRGLDTFIVSFGTTKIMDLGYGGADVFVVETGAKLTAVATYNWTGSTSVINDGDVTIQTKGKLIDLSSLPLRNGFKVENVGARAKLVGSAAEDTISGGKFSDTIQGYSANDILSGGLGADTFLIDVGVDKINDLGLGGSDILQVYLGAEVDAVMAAPWTARGTVNYGADGDARLYANGKSINLSSVTVGNGFHIENLTNVGGSISSAAISILGSAAEDTIIGGNGNDTLYGGRGDDRIVGLGAYDRIDAGPGSDTVILSRANDSGLVSGRGGDSIIGGDGTDTLQVLDSMTGLGPNISGFENLILSASSDYFFTTGTTFELVAPTISSQSPVDESKSANVDENITVTFSEPIQRSAGEIRIKKIDGATTSIVETYGIDSTNITIAGKTLTIDPSLNLEGNVGYSIEFDSDSLVDLSGNSITKIADYNFTTATASDKSAPTIASFTPVSGATGVNVATNLQVKFSESIVRGDGNILLKKTDGTTVATYEPTSANVTISGNTLTIDPAADLDANTQYVIEFASNSIQDSLQNSFVGSDNYNFSTSPDTNAPVVSRFTPSDAATGVGIGSNIVVEFNEPVTRGSGDIVLKRSDGTTIATYGANSDRITISGSTLTINPDTNLNTNTAYLIDFADNAVVDLSGNAYVYESSNSPYQTSLTVTPEFVTNNSLLSIRGSTESTASEELVVLISKGALDLSKIGSVIDATLVIDASFATGLVSAVGSSFNDELLAGTQSTSVDGGAGEDTLVGSTASDTLAGGAAADSLSGEGGADSLGGGLGVDTLLGGEGSDILFFKGDEDNFGDVLDGGSGTDTLHIEGTALLWESPSKVKAFEAITLKEGASLSIDYRAITFKHNYNDYQINDISKISGVSGGTLETVTVVSDKYSGDQHGFSELVDLSGITLDANVVLAIEGFDGNDTIKGGLGGANSVNGGDDNDLITTDLGADTIRGGEGLDSIVAGAGNDLIVGGGGIDTMSGGTGKDTFTFESYSEANWTNASIAWTLNNDTVDADGEPVTKANADNVRDLLVERIEGFDVLNDFLDLPDDGSDTDNNDIPSSIAAIQDVAATVVSTAVLGEVGALFQSPIIPTNPVPYYTVTNGVLKVYDDDKLTASTNSTAKWALHNWLAFVDSIATANITNGAAGVIVFEYDEHTFVFARDTNPGQSSTKNDLLIQLVDVTGITAFSEQSNGLQTTLAGS